MLDKLNEGNNKQKLDRILEKLELYYPEHKVFALDSIDKQLRENISNFSSSLGFQFPSEFLEQLGYTMIKGEEVKNLRNKVIYAPGNEPEGIKNKVNNILNRLNEYYPDKEINKGLQKEHKALSLSISGMYQWLGYESIKSFLETYGYNYNIDSEVGGRPSNDYNELIEYLVSKYSNNPMYSSVLDLIANEPEYSSKLKTLANRGPKVLGGSLKQFLLDKNVLIKEKQTSESAIAKKIKLEEEKKNLLLEKIRERCELYNKDFEEIIKQYDNFEVEYKKHGDSIVLNGVKNIYEILEIPFGIDKILESFYDDLEGVTTLIVSENVQKVNFILLDKVSSLKEVILNKPKFIIKKEYCDRFVVRIDMSDEIDAYLKTIDSSLIGKVTYYISVIQDCIRVSKYNKRIKFFIDRDFKLVFSGYDKIYLTDILLFGEIELFDKILEELFKTKWIEGIVNLYNKYDRLDKVRLDDDFNVIESGENNED